MEPQGGEVEQLAGTQLDLERARRRERRGTERRGRRLALRVRRVQEGEGVQQRRRGRRRDE